MLRVAPDGNAGRDVVVDVDSAHTVDELAAVLADHVGAAMPARIVSRRFGRLLAPEAAVRESHLASGDELVVSRMAAAGEPNEIPLRAVSVDVLAGPDSGRSTLLLPGTYVVGRHADCDVTIDDVTVSRRHARVTVGDDWAVAVEPFDGTANGVTVNGVEIEAATAVGADDVIGLGGSRLAIRSFERADHYQVDQLGQIDFQRTPYRRPVVADRPTEVIGPIPVRPEPRRFQIMSVIAPLAAGLALYAFSRQVQFLALTLVSPIAFVANAWEDRRSGRRSARRDIAAFREMLVARRQELVELRDTERVERFRAAPDLADLVRRAELRTIDLWPRGRRAADFLHVRLGLGASTTRYEVALDRGGADDLRDEALEAIAGVTAHDHVPIVVDLVESGVLGIHGEAALVDGLAASVVIQAACLHSPEDLTIVAAVSPHRRFGWLKWLPHVRSVASPIAGRHVVVARDQANALVADLLEAAAFRAAQQQGFGSGTVEAWPRVLCLFDADVELDPVETARLLDLAPTVGFSVVWLASTQADVPRQASRVMSVVRQSGELIVGRLWSIDPTVATATLEVERLRVQLADRAARALAPVRDASTASLATSIPRTAALLDVLDVGAPTAHWVTERWLARRPYGLPFPIGSGADGVTTIDLVHDGPHALIGGTSGAGKSELLQSMVASLAATHSPQRLNFLFVDYKGGASSKVFERLPHTVGYVTNLSADLALRALTSLRAELNHRMALMEGRAKDLAEMLQVAPHDAPASLVIVVDEFATLVKEVPEFVAGIVDIAQRGRSLGIHLVLATQRPSGSVNENILANTNLRISLRMLDRPESTAIIGSPEAADIPVPLRGRGFIRSGPHQLVAFQSAYGGAPLLTASTRRPIGVADFANPDDAPHASASGAESTSKTQLDAVVDAIVAATQALSVPPARRPWCDVLPDVTTLDRVIGDARASTKSQYAGRLVPVGMIDAPERQEQRPLSIDLEDGGGCLVFGSGGSGKTTFLRTVAASLALTAPDAAVVAFDFASRGLTTLRQLPNVIDVATGDDIEAVSRHLTMLDRELGDRRRLLAAANAEHLTAYNQNESADGRPTLPRIVVLIDGFGGLVDAFADTGSMLIGAGEGWIDRLNRIVVDGRQNGIHVVIASDRRNAVPARVHAAIANRVILHHAEEAGYADHGIPSARVKQLDLQPGRGLWLGSVTMQVAVIGRDTSARGQHEAIADLAAHLDRARTTTLRSSPLPDRLPITDVAAGDAGVRSPVFGIHDVSARPARFDLTWSHAVVVGPPRSGRTTTLETLILQLHAEHDVYAVGPASSRLAASVSSGSDVDVACGRAESVLPVLDRLANRLEMGAGRRHPVLLIDDIDAIDDPALASVWERLTSNDELRVVASLESRSMAGFTTNPMITLLRRSRQMLVLQPDDPGEFLQVTGVRAPQRPGIQWVAGRGVLLADRMPQVVQVAVVDDAAQSD